jgi:hypothetical protein
VGAVTTQTGGGVTFVYHSDDDQEGGETVLTALVAWRAGRATHAGWRAWLRRWRYRLGIGPLPLNHRFSIGRDPGLWYGSTGIHGEHETLFHPVLRAVRALGIQYPLPSDGTTLVLLVDETGATPRVEVKQMRAPRLSRAAPAPQPGSGDVAHQVQWLDVEAWRPALEADPHIAAFLAPIPGAGRA